MLVNQTLQEVLSRSEVPESVTGHLITQPRTRQRQERNSSMSCPKTHKEQLKIRPIILACIYIWQAGMASAASAKTTPERLGPLKQHC